MRSFVVGGRGLHRQPHGRPPGRARAGHRLRQPLGRQARVHRGPPRGRARHAGRGRRARPRAARRGDEGARSGGPPRRQPRGALGARAHPARSRAGHHRHLQRARGDAPRRACRGSSSRRRAPSTARPTKTCAEGDLGCLPISLYGASKFAGEALIAAFVECFGLTGVHLPLRQRGRPARHARRRRSISSRSSATSGPSSRCWATGGRPSRTSSSPTASTGMLFGLDHATEQAQRPQPRAARRHQRGAASPSCASRPRPTRTRPSATPAATAAGPATCRARAWIRASSRRSASGCGTPATRPWRAPSRRWRARCSASMAAERDQAVILAGGLGHADAPAHRADAQDPAPGRRPAVRGLAARAARRRAASPRRCSASATSASEVRRALGDGARFGAARPLRRGRRAPARHRGRAPPRARRCSSPTFLVTYGDTYLPFDYAAPLRDLRAHPEALGTMAVFRNDDRCDRSNTAVAGELVVRYEKRPRDAPPRSGARSHRLRRDGAPPRGHRRAARGRAATISRPSSATSPPRGACAPSPPMRASSRSDSPEGLADLEAELLETRPGGPRR